MFQYGIGVERSIEIAFGHYVDSAEAGNPEGMNTLGILYESGIHVEQSYFEAINWYRASAEAGNGYAMTNLGLMYYNGRGVQSSNSTAAHWFHAAADIGIPYAMAHLGLMYQNGWGVHQSYSEAVHWFRAGAFQGDAYAMLLLGMMYESGLGVPQSSEVASYWINLSSTEGAPYNRRQQPETIDISSQRVLNVAFLRIGQRLSITGTAPTQAQTELTNHRLYDLDPSISVLNAVEFDNYTDNIEWQEALRFGLEVISELDRAEVIVSQDRVVVEAVASSRVQRHEWLLLLEQNAPTSITLEANITSAPPRILPFSLQYVQTPEGGYFLSCSASNEAERSHILNAALGARLSGVVACRLGSGSPALSWATAAEVAINAASRFDLAFVSVLDTSIVLLVSRGTPSGIVEDLEQEMLELIPDEFSVNVSFLPGLSSPYVRPDFFTLSPEVAVVLGDLFLTGEIGFSQNTHEALDFYEFAADAGNIVGMLRQADMYDGRSGEYSPATAFELRLRAAEMGSPAAAFFVALRYHALGDYNLAFEWFTFAADRGVNEAAIFLARYYEFGLGVLADNELAIGWYRSAAQQGYAIDADLPIYNFGPSVLASLRPLPRTLTPER